MNKLKFHRIDYQYCNNDVVIVNCVDSGGQLWVARSVVDPRNAVPPVVPDCCTAAKLYLYDKVPKTALNVGWIKAWI